MEHYYRKYVDALRNKVGARMALRSALPSDAGDGESPRQHYSVAKKDRAHVDLYTFANKHVGDPALKVINVANCAPQF